MITGILTNAYLKEGKMMKKNGLFISIAAVVFVLMLTLESCASFPVGLVLSEVNGSGSKSATLTRRVVLGVFGNGYASVAETAQKGSITRVATVEYYQTLGFLGLWVDCTTIVTGE